MKWHTACRSLAFFALLSLMSITATAYSAFHDGSDESCAGCHKSDSLLNKTDPSSTCLECHAKSYRVLSETGSVYTPAGDFYWLTQSYANSRQGGWGERHGHNVIAADFGLVADTTLVTAPSNGPVAYQSAWLQCTSCHDPHVTAQNSYRLLGNTNYNGGSMAAGGFKFKNPAPIALACLNSNGEFLAETDRDHPDYGVGMSEWCTNCHSGYNGYGKHPTGNRTRLNRVATQYNVYKATGLITGQRGVSYDFLVPFERGWAETSRLRCNRTDGPTATANVMCLSCHRAHASAFDSIGRWDFRVEFLSTSEVLSSPDGHHAYYGNDINIRYGPLQRELCNKCHIKDKTR